MTIETPEELRKRMSDESEGNGKAAKPDFTRPYHTFDFDQTIRGHHYKGTFTAKVPSIGQQIEIGRMKTIYLPQGAAADMNAAALVEAICYLEVCLEKDKRPEWWAPMDFLDSVIVMRVYAEVIAHANNFLGVSKKSGSTAETDEGHEEARGEDAPAESSVDEDVQPARKRREVVISERE